MSLLRFAGKRLLAMIPILVGVSLITFALVHLTPGDPIDRMVAAHPDMTTLEERQLRAQYGLDGSFWTQYFAWLGNVLGGDFGEVIGSNHDAGALVVSRLPETVALGLFGWVFGLLIAIPTGIYAAVHRDELGDTVSRLVALSGISIPNFWLGLVVLVTGALWLGRWPVLAPREPLYHPSMLWYLLLPGVTIGVASAAILMRITRSAMVEELSKPYVTAARARGLPERTVVLKHALRNSLLSVVTVAAFLTAGIVSGAVVIEYVFNWPGLGMTFVDAIHDRELNLIVAITLVIGVAIVLANLLADLAYALLDPRIRYD